VEDISERAVFVAVFVTAFVVDDLSLLDASVGLMWPRFAPGLVMKIFERRGLDIGFNCTEEAKKGFVINMEYKAPRIRRDET